jgi:hypothetical protein
VGVADGVGGWAATGKLLLDLTGGDFVCSPNTLVFCLS